MVRRTQPSCASAGAGLPKESFPRLPHSFGPWRLQAWMGHASPAITDRSYIDGQRAAAAERRAALRVLDGGRATAAAAGERR